MTLNRISILIAVTLSFWSHAFTQERTPQPAKAVAKNSTKLALDLKAKLVGHTKQVFFLDFTPNGEFLATSSDDDYSTRLWNTKTGQLIAAVDGSSARFSPDGQVLVTVHKKALKLWDSSTGKPLRTLTGHKESIVSIDLSSDGSKLATGSEDGTLRLWDTATGRNLATATVWRVKKPPRYRIVSRAFYFPVLVLVQFSPDHQRVVTKTVLEDSSAKLWEVPTGQLKAEFTGPTKTTNSKKTAGVGSVEFSPDGRFILTQRYSEAKLWDSATTKLVEEFKAVSGSAFSHDSKLLGLVRKDEQIGLLDLDTFKLLPTPGVTTWDLNQGIFSPDDRTYVGAGGYKEYQATLIDVATGQVRATIPLISKWGILDDLTDIDILSFHPGSEYLMGVSHNSARIWDAKTGTLAWEISEGRDPAKFSRDGTLLGTVGKDKKTVFLWNVTVN